MTDPLQTSWGALATDDTVLDATGKQWRVYSEPERSVGSDPWDVGTVTASITDGDRYVTVTKKATETVLTVPKAVADITDGAVATESAAQSQTRQATDTFPAADTLSPLELRTHLYLVHQFSGATRVAVTEELLADHTRLHSEAATLHMHQEA